MHNPHVPPNCLKCKKPNPEANGFCWFCNTASAYNEALREQAERGNGNG